MCGKSFGRVCLGGKMSIVEEVIYMLVGLNIFLKRYLLH